MIVFDEFENICGMSRSSGMEIWKLYFVSVLFFLFCVCRGVKSDIVCNPAVGTPVLSPIGKARGVKPGRVSWFFNKEITSWDGKTEYWWKNEFVNQSLVDDAFSKTIMNLAGENDEKVAWDKIFKEFNKKKHLVEVGYNAGEKIAVKLNLNADQSYDVQSQANTISPQFVKAFLRSIVYQGGVREEDITLFDASRVFPHFLYFGPEGIEEFKNVKIVDAQGKESYVERKVIPDPNTKLFFSTKDVPLWNTTLLPKCVNEAKYVIEIDAFRGHTLAGMTESGKNWFGSVYRTDWDCGSAGHWCPVTLHQFVNITGDEHPGPWLPQRPMGVYNVLVDLLGCDDTGGKGLLFLSDALYGGQCQSSRTCFPTLFEMTPFDGGWSSSIFISMDPIALDSVLLDFLRTEPNQLYTRIGCGDNYLHEAALAENPPSKTKYQPSGHALDSLGTHEHWNDFENKQYSRNLKIGMGIELIKVWKL